MLKGKKKSYKLPENAEVFVSAINEAPQKKKLKETTCSPYTGLIYTFLSSLSILLSSVFVKKLTYISPAQLAMIRSIAALSGSFPIAIYCRINILGPRNFFWFLSIRAALGAATVYLNLAAYRLLPIAVASIILSSIPAVVTLAARICLKEPCGFVHVMSILLTILGVLTSIRLPELVKDLSGTHLTRDYINGLACQFSSVFLLSFIIVSLRKMQNIHLSVLLFYSGMIGTIENAILTALLSSFSWPRCGGWDTAQVVLIGELGFLANCFLTTALQKEMANVVTTSKAAIDIVMSSVLQSLFFNSIPDIYTLGGGLLVIFAVGSLGFYKWLVAQPENSVYKRRFKYLLL